MMNEQIMQAADDLGMSADELRTILAFCAKYDLPTLLTRKDLMAAALTRNEFLAEQ